MFLRQEFSLTTAIDLHAKIYSAIEELIILGQDYCYVKSGDQIIGIVCLEELLEKYHDRGIPEETIVKYVVPFFLN